MNTNQFKKLIKESVREVIQEELSSILKEAILNNSKVKTELNEGVAFSFNSSDVINRKSSNPELRNRMNEMYGFNNNQPVVNKQAEAVVESVGGDKNPFANLFAQTAMEMTPQDRAALRQLD